MEAPSPFNCPVCRGTTKVGCYQCGTEDDCDHCKGTGWDPEQVDVTAFRAAEEALCKKMREAGCTVLTYEWIDQGWRVGRHGGTYGRVAVAEFLLERKPLVRRLVMKEIVVDGERYVRACDSGPIKIVVLERGFIYVGRVDEEGDPVVKIHGARSIIRWGTTKHLGELVDGPLPDTKLGASCIVQCRTSHILHMIEVSQDAWCKHIV